MATVLIAGCGDVGGAAGRLLAASGHRVLGLSRSPAALPEALIPVAADLTNRSALRTALADAAPAGGIDVVAYTAAASGRTEEAYRAAYVTGLGKLLEVLTDRGDPVTRLAFTASTAVYGQDDGGWVDEDSPTHPSRFSGDVLLASEALLAASPFTTTSLRVAGIYGPGRDALIRRVRDGDEVCVDGVDEWTNRVHRDDVASALAHVLGFGTTALDRPDATYVVVDDEPAPRCEVARWLATRLGVPAPRTVAATAVPTRRGGNKRCSNARLRTSGWEPSFPTYREGYGALLPA